MRAAAFIAGMAAYFLVKSVGACDIHSCEFEDTAPRPTPTPVLFDVPPLKPLKETKMDAYKKAICELLGIDPKTVKAVC